jgi:pyruvate/2-oxoglutarate dehydrogenase complex dihydrolipoamide acyltransferase (E2) component
MPTKVTMPQLGESVVEGTLTRWLKSVGEQVEEYEPLLEVNTDKVDSEIPSPISGTLLEILVPEGTTVQAGELLALIGDEDEAEAGEQEDAAPPVQSTANGDGVEQKQAPQPARAAETDAAPAVGRSELGFISPVVAKISSEHNLDLREVTGTGQGGRITKKDVLAYLEEREAAPKPAPSPEFKADSGLEKPAARKKGDLSLPLSPLKYRER